MPGEGAEQVTIVIVSGWQVDGGNRPLAVPLLSTSVMAAISGATAVRPAAVGVADGVVAEGERPADPLGVSAQATAIPASTITAAVMPTGRATRRGAGGTQVCGGSAAGGRIGAPRCLR